MTCPICGREAPADPTTGYNADDICPPCADRGWSVSRDGTLTFTGILILLPKAPKRKIADDDVLMITEDDYPF